MRKLLVAALAALTAGFASPVFAEVAEITITRGDGVGFLPLMVMERQQLVEKNAAEAGVDLTVNWVNISGSGAVNDALLSGSAQFISGGIPGMLTLWDRTKGKQDVVGVGSISSQPMYLNTNSPTLKSLDEVTESDKIAVTAIKISIPAIIMQMYAREKYGEDQTFRFDPYTVPMKHPDGVVALLSGAAGITAHYTSPPFHHREIQDPKVRTIQTTNDVMGGSTTFAIMVATAKFREENPKVFKAVFNGLDQAHEFINQNREEAAAILLDSMGGRGWEVGELVDVLKDPDIKFDITPENVMRYGGFMHGVGSISHELTDWTDLFAEEAHSLPGS